MLPEKKPLGVIRGGEDPAAVEWTVVNTTFDAERDTPKFVVSEWIPRGVVTTLYARGGIGKSRMGLQLACAVAMNRDFLGLGVDGGTPAVYLSAEDPASVVRWRLQALEKAGLADSEHHPIVLAPPLSCPPALWANGEPTPLGEALLGHAYSAGIVVIDPLALVYADNEIDRASVTTFLAWLNGMAERTQAAILLLGHPAKGSTGEQAIYSGSTAWRNAARCVLRMRPAQDGEGDGTHVLLCDKLNLAPMPQPIAIEGDGVSWKSCGPVDVEEARRIRMDEKEREREERDAEIYRLVEVEGYSQRAAAQAIGCSVSTINAAMGRMKE